MGINLNKNDDDEIMAEINMTPLIDIMLVLLIIFMVTSSVSLESGLDIDLPKTNSKSEAKNESVVLVSLDRLGNISVQGKEVAYDGLEGSIKQALEEEKTTLVIFEGDTNANLGKSIEVMDIAKKAGATKFAIATQDK